MLRNRPRLVVTCGRCGKPRTGIRHDCVVSSGRAAGRRATLKPQVTFGKCETSKKPLGNPLTHVCKPKSDFKARKSRAAKQAKERERAKARKKLRRAAPVRVVPRRPVQTPSVRGVQDRMAPRGSGRVRVRFDAGLAACPRNHTSG